MIGDKLVIQDVHRKAARGVLALLGPAIEACQGRYALAIAGESGSGKSETAAALAEQLREGGVKSVVFQQDDYFVFPPKTNTEMRKRAINHVGPSEVRLELLDRHIQEALDGKEAVRKPLVLYEEDRITAETLSLGGVKVVIAEGTYTTLLKNVQARIFIDRTYRETRRARGERGRETQDEWLESILALEHTIISAHKEQAQLLVSRDYDVVRNVEKGRGTAQQ
jgi:uridine kinase